VRAWLISMNSNSLAVYDYITCAGCRPGTKNASRMGLIQAPQLGVFPTCMFRIWGEYGDVDEQIMCCTHDFI